MEMFRKAIKILSRAMMMGKLMGQKAVLHVEAITMRQNSEPIFGVIFIDTI